MKYIIEIATTDFGSTEAAVNGGADRIELCSALSEGGLTPSFGLIKHCREKFGLPIFPIIRPRAGDFLYNDDEYKIITKEVKLCKELGCDGIVVGFLKKDGRVDKKRTARIVEMAYPMEVSFHRAFDRCVDPYEALEEIIGTGCQRILTSGQKPTAIEGIELIKNLIDKASDRIIIMPGSGINRENIKSLTKTGAIEFHAALRATVKSRMEFIHPSFSDHGNYQYPGIIQEEVKALRNELQKN